MAIPGPRLRSVVDRSKATPSGIGIVQGVTVKSAADEYLKASAAFIKGVHDLGKGIASMGESEFQFDRWAARTRIQNASLEFMAQQDPANAAKYRANIVAVPSWWSLDAAE